VARPRLFAIVVITTTVVCGLAVLAYFGYLVWRSPGGFLLGVAVALLPFAGLLWFFWWLDSYEPEPRRLVVAAVLWGAFAASGAALVINTLAIHVIGDIAAVVEAPFVEEGMKGLFLVLLLVWRRQEIDGMLDGLIYAGFVGAGFACVENVTYFVRGYDGIDLPSQAGQPDVHLHGGVVLLGELVLRGVLTPFAHPLFTAATGLGIGIAASTRTPVLRWIAPIAGYLAAVSMHAGWNGMLTAGVLAVTLVALTFYLRIWALYLVLCFVLRAGARRTLWRSLYDAAQRGLVPAGDIGWVVDEPARRWAATYARARGGKPALATLRAWQLAAIRFGFLHHRALRGTAPADYGERGAAYLETMARLRVPGGAG
jgi:protease PrsW